MDSVERTLIGVSFIPAAGAVSFYVPEIASNLPPGKEAQLVVESNSELMVSITSNDTDFAGTNRIGNHAHSWFSTANKTTYSYDANGTVPELFVTVVNPSLDQGATVDVSFKLSDRIIITAPSTDTTVDSDYTITWTTEDKGDQAMISLYYATDNSGYDGILIVGDLIEGTDTSYSWDTSALANGDYYIYATLDDGVNDVIVSDYASGKITVEDRYIRLNSDGSEYTGSGNYSDEPWACVRDNVTGLTWEVKTDDGGVHDKDHTYRWGGQTALYMGGTRYYDWSTLVVQSNIEALCGLSNWRVPTHHQLRHLAIMDMVKSMQYFPNTNYSSLYWSSVPYVYSVYYFRYYYAWYVNHGSGFSYYYFPYEYNAVRLVHNAQ